MFWFVCRVHFTSNSMLILPNDVRTVWEIKQRNLVDMAVDRGCYIDQSQSLNIHMDQPNFGKLTSLHFHTWSRVCLPFHITVCCYNYMIIVIYHFISTSLDMLLLEIHVWRWFVHVFEFQTCYWQGLKTGMYYLRSRAAADAIKFTVDTSILKVVNHYIFYSLIINSICSIVTERVLNLNAGKTSDSSWWRN